jgi:hypothetical protein
MASKKKNSTNGKAKISNSEFDQSPKEGGQAVETSLKVSTSMDQEMKTTSKTSILETALKVSNPITSKCILKAKYLFIER